MASSRRLVHGQRNVCGFGPPVQLHSDSTSMTYGVAAAHDSLSRAIKRCPERRQTARHLLRRRQDTNGRGRLQSAFSNSMSRFNGTDRLVATAFVPTPLLSRFTPQPIHLPVRVAPHLSDPRLNAIGHGEQS
jgi:hypothetical protein